MITSFRYQKRTLIMFVKDGFYPVESSGTKPLDDEAADHGELNSHVTHIEDAEGNVLWVRK